MTNIRTLGRRRILIVTATALAGVFACKPRAVSETKGIFEDNRSAGVNLIFDLSECTRHFMGQKSYGKVYFEGMDYVNREIKAKIGNKVVVDSVDEGIEYLKKVDIETLLNQAANHAKDNVAQIKGSFGYSMTSFVPNALSVVVSAPLFKEVDIGAAIRKMAPTFPDVAIYPYLGVVILPQCFIHTQRGVYYDVSDNVMMHDGKGHFFTPEEFAKRASYKKPEDFLAHSLSPLQVYHWRFKTGGQIVGIWRVKKSAGASPSGSATADATPDAAAAAPAAGPAEVVPWHVMTGFIWGPMYDPDQLRGPIFGAGFGFRNKNLDLPASEFDKLTPWAKSSTMTRPMAIWGYRKPSEAKTWNIQSMFQNVIGNLFTNFLVPTHYALWFDTATTATRKTYDHLYAGFNLTSSEVVDAFFNDPVEVSTPSGGAAAADPVDAAKGADGTAATDQPGSAVIPVATLVPTTPANAAPAEAAPSGAAPVETKPAGN